MDLYNVIITPKAFSMLEDYVSYIQYTLLNSEAAKQVWADAIETTGVLQSAAASLRYCAHPKLHESGYRSIKFRHHNYVMLYRIEDRFVYIDAIYHQLQDYENIFIENLTE